MAATYFLGVFNDNFFKQAAMLIAVVASAKLQGDLIVVFAAPFILFAAPAGWAADRFSKRHVVIGAKAFELCAMIAGAAGIMTGNWLVIFTMLGLMAFQSTVFGPALNGSIPELYPASYVIRANAIVKVVTTFAILIGIAAAGQALSLQGEGLWGAPMGRTAVAVTVVLVALLGVVVSFGVPRRPAAAPNARFPWGAMFDTLRTLRRTGSDPLLAIAVGANGLFWFTASLQALLINAMGKTQFMLSYRTTSALLVAEGLGVAAGGMLAGRFAYGRRWYRVLAPSSGILGACMVMVVVTPLVPEGARLAALVVILTAMGIAGGVFLVPLASFIQVRPPADRKGTVLAAANFVSWFAILLSGPAFNAMSAPMRPTTGFAVGGALMLAVAAWLAVVWNRSRSRRWDVAHALTRRGNNVIDTLLRLFVKGALALRYRVEVKGLEEVAERGTSGILFLPNHPAYIDPFIVLSTLNRDFAPRSLADKDQIDRFFIRWAARRAGVRPIPDASKYRDAPEKIEAALRESIEGLKNGENLLFYPAGRINRSRFEDLGGKGAVERIVTEVPEARVVLVRTRGLWGSMFSRASGRHPVVAECVSKAVRSLLASFIVFAPKRTVSVELYEPDDLPRGAGRARLNRCLEDFYNEEAPRNTYVPYTIWESGGVRTMPEPPGEKAQADISSVPRKVREAVRAHLEEMTGAAAIDESTRLGRDLGIDSLSMAGLVVWLEEEFALRHVAPETLETAGDAMLAAAGGTPAAGPVTLTPPPAQWFEPAGKPLLAGGKITDAFLARAAAAPDSPVAADQASGARTYRDMITGVILLSKRFKAMRGDHLGIMLPASLAADTVYLAALFAGKTPVMLNWTAGRRGMQHAVEMLDIDAVITAAPLVRRIEFQQGDLGPLKGRFIHLEELVKGLSTFARLSAWLKSRLSWRALRRAEVGDTAVVLFTSGSESTPKAVPLTHSNILSNIRDILCVIDVAADERMVGIFPPFHSFGLTCTMILPLVTGVRVFHHPNPTDGATIARLIENYRATMLLGTPTFLSGIVRAAGEGHLESLRLIVTGAEKCTEAVYEALERRCPRATLIEGYGASECSPVISVNAPEAPAPFTIGRVLPSLEYRIVSPETGEAVGRGEEGMLIVRGPSVFGGYLHHEGPSPFVEFEGRRWYRTGDIVREVRGVLEFAGRLRRFTKVAGEMISLPAVEEALANRFAPADADGPVLAVEALEGGERPEMVLFTTVDIDRAAANEALREAGLSALHSIHRVVRLDELPLLGTGKTDYRALRARPEEQ